MKDQLITLQKRLKNQYISKNKGKIERLFYPNNPLRLAECFLEVALIEEKERIKNQDFKEDILSGKAYFLHECERIDHKDRVVLENLLTVCTDPKKRLFIEGAAGAGKSTLCRYIAHAWGNNQAPWAAFDWVFYIRLRDLTGAWYQQANVSALDVLEKVCFGYSGGEGGLQRLSSENRQALQQIFTEDADKVLFVLDGYDEIDLNLPIFGVVWDDLIKSDFHLILTSRPGTQLSTNNLNIYQHLAVLGFADEQVEQYVQQFFLPKNTPGVQAEEGGACLAWLKKSPNVWSVVHTPIQLELMCSSWQGLKDKSKLNLTILYDTLWDSLLSRFWATQKDTFQQLELERIKKTEKIAIEYMKHLAFLGMQTQRIVLTLPELRSAYQNLSSLPVAQSQFIRTIKALGMLRYDDEQEEKAEFVHLTFQEFFAANYVAEAIEEFYHKRLHSLSPEALANFITETKNQRFYEVMWCFVAGLLSRKDEPLKLLQFFFDLFLQTSSSQYKLLELPLLIDCLAEAGMPNIIQKASLMENVKGWIKVYQEKMQQTSSEEEAYLKQIIILNRLFQVVNARPILVNACSTPENSSIFEKTKKMVTKTYLKVKEVLQNKVALAKILQGLGDIFFKTIKSNPQAISPSVEILIPSSAELLEKPWYFDYQTKKGALLPPGETYMLLDASSKDKEKVVNLYQQYPYPGYEVASVEVVYNPVLDRKFSLHITTLDHHHNNDAFKPDWQKDAEAERRKQIYGQLEELVKPYHDKQYPHVKLLPLWHATQEKFLASIFKTGFVGLAKTDAGFFGKGIYGAREAQYAYKVYGKEALLLNWVAFYSAYPVIYEDMHKFTFKADAQTLATGKYRNYDAHFVPVVPKDPARPDEVNYYPCKANQTNVYTEVVVFESAASLPRYLVKLQKTLLPSPSMQLLSPQPGHVAPKSPKKHLIAPKDATKSDQLEKHPELPAQASQEQSVSSPTLLTPNSLKKSAPQIAPKPPKNQLLVFTNATKSDQLEKHPELPTQASQEQPVSSPNLLTPNPLKKSPPQVAPKLALGIHSPLPFSKTALTNAPVLPIFKSTPSSDHFIKLQKFIESKSQQGYWQVSRKGSVLTIQFNTAMGISTVQQPIIKLQDYLIYLPEWKESVKEWKLQEGGVLRADCKQEAHAQAYEQALKSVLHVPSTETNLASESCSIS